MNNQLSLYDLYKSEIIQRIKDRIELSIQNDKKMNDKQRRIFKKLDLINDFVIKTGAKLEGKQKDYFVNFYLKMEEYEFMEVFKSTMGIELYRVIKNHYFIV
jgi:hypothetical protein